MNKIKYSTMNKAIAFFSGLIFGVGLIVSGMTNANKVIDFLNITSPRGWDPTLMFVMVGGIIIHTLAYFLKKKSLKPWFKNQWSDSLQLNINKRLILGSIFFGLGWGIAGYCPGPVITSLPGAIFSGQESTLFFVAALISGMLVGNRLITK